MKSKLFIFFLLLSSSIVSLRAQTIDPKEKTVAPEMSTGVNAPDAIQTDDSKIPIGGKISIENNSAIENKKTETVNLKAGQAVTTQPKKNKVVKISKTTTSSK